jgi:hypothetical protein
MTFAPETAALTVRPEGAVIGTVTDDSALCTQALVLVLNLQRACAWNVYFFPTSPAKVSEDVVV